MRGRYDVFAGGRAGNGGDGLVVAAHGRRERSLLDRKDLQNKI